ncbi:MAG TPA: GNAT family N-acetyltransferase [Bacteroidales bacterium]|nr:GNAT family N-acetyltransferase [Bacteroidales bacterium]HPS26167.1 GNAT family N-acetyltransferase [Bacteroidales bacterium]
MENIIAPLPRLVLEKELSDKFFFRKTNFGNNQIFIINAHNAPNVMQEIGRLREIAFRDAGGGTGKSVDIDEYDICEKPYEQMIVWNPADMEIVGGYRFIECAKALYNPEGLPYIATTELFSFSQRFLKEFLPHTIELGRSFVQPGYQPLVNSRKGMFSLENLWDGIGGLLMEMPHIKYFFGKVTMYPHFNQRARDIIMYFLFKYFPDKDNLVKPIAPLEIKTELKELEPIFNGGNYGADYKMLIQTLRELNENIPPLVKAYMNLTSTMRSFGTAINPGFGSVQETGILVTVEDIYENRKERHISSFRKE